MLERGQLQKDKIGPKTLKNPRTPKAIDTWLVKESLTKIWLDLQRSSK